MNIQFEKEQNIRLVDIHHVHKNATLVMILYRDMAFIYFNTQIILTILKVQLIIGKISKAIIKKMTKALCG